MEKSGHEIPDVSFRSSSEDVVLDSVVVNADKEADKDVKDDSKKQVMFDNVITMNLTPAADARPSSREPIQIIWKNLSYDVTKKSGLPCKRAYEKKRILHAMSGEIAGGTITALMGPSGAGKSTLLNCVSSKLTDGVNGEIFFRFPPRSTVNKDENSLRIGFVPQTDHLFIQFTVHESVLFASKMMNPGFSHEEHKEKVSDVLKSLDLESRASLKLKKLSGGQLKRASIAIELISHPKILILDEPTSGLDSDNSEMVISMLKNLSTIPVLEAPAIVATIHQPSVEVFMMFDNIYLLNRFGSNIYSGPPQGVMPYMESFGFRKRIDINPADYMIAIANAKHKLCGIAAAAAVEHRKPQRQIQRQVVWDNQFQRMADKTRNISPDKPRVYLYHDIPLSDFEIKTPNSFFCQFGLLLIRSFQAYVTKSATSVGKFAIFLLMAMAMTHIFDTPVGTEDGCWTQIMNLSVSENTSEVDAIKKSFNDTVSENVFAFDLAYEMSRLTEGSMYLFLIIMFYMFMPALTIVMAFPSELKTVAKEVSNSWYSTTAYYFAKQIADFLILFACMLPAVGYSYWASQQPADLWRFSYLFLIVYLIAAIWQSRGIFLSIILNKNETLALITVLGLMYLTVFLSGFYVKVSNMPALVRPLTDISDMRRGFESMLAIIYGFGRCSQGITIDTLFNDVFTEKNPIKLISKFWSILPVSYEDGREVAKKLNLDENYLDQVIDAMNYNYGTYLPTTPEEDFEPSFMLTLYNVYEDSVADNRNYLILMFIATQVAVYIALRYNTRVSRL